MNLENGEIILLNEKEYVCISNVKLENNNYFCLMSNFKPLEIKFAKELDNGQLEIINNKEQKENLLQLFAKDING